MRNLFLAALLGCSSPGPVDDPDETSSTSEGSGVSGSVEDGDGDDTTGGMPDLPAPTCDDCVALNVTPWQICTNERCDATDPGCAYFICVDECIVEEFEARVACTLEWDDCTDDGESLACFVPCFYEEIECLTDCVDYDACYDARIACVDEC